MLRDTPEKFFAMAFWDFKMHTICFSNVIEILILFFMMLKNEKVSSTPMFSTMCQQSKSDYIVLGWEKRNGIGLEPKVKIVRHL